MSDSPLLPGQHGWKDASGKPLPVEFYRFLRDLVAYLRQSGANTADIAALEARIEALEAGGTDATLQGLESVRIAGTLAGGLVQFRLQGDSQDPGPSLYYGTDENGIKGFHAHSIATLSDVDLSGLTDGDSMVWNSTAGKWEPGSPETPQFFNLITSDGDPFVTSDNDLLVVS